MNKNEILKYLSLVTVSEGHLIKTLGCDIPFLTRFPLVLFLLILVNGLRLITVGHFDNFLSSVSSECEV